MAAVRSAVHDAGSSFESVMKAMLSVNSGTARELVVKLESDGYFDELHEEDRAGFSQAVLMSLPFLRNRLGGHGRGVKEDEIPEAYARLATNLAAVLGGFLMTLHVERAGETNILQEPSDAEIVEDVPVVSDFPVDRGDDDIPF